MSSKDIALRVPVKMFDDLNRIAKNENRPRARIMREMLERGIEERAKNLRRSKEKRRRLGLEERANNGSK